MVKCAGTLPLEGVSSRFAEGEFVMLVAWQKAGERRDAAKLGGDPAGDPQSGSGWGCLGSARR